MKQKILDIITIVLCLIFVIGICICIPKSCAANPSKESNPIIFEFSNVDSIAYVWENKCFLIWYDDADAFDYDAMAYRAGKEEWYGEFVYLDIEDSLIGEFLEDFHKYTKLKSDYKSNWEQIDELSQHWGIVNWDELSESYKLIRIHEKGWWFK